MGSPGVMLSEKRAVNIVLSGNLHANYIVWASDVSVL